MEVLVDTSVWIDYFRSGKHSDRMDFLLDENLIVTNDLILTELLPSLMIRNEEKVVKLLKLLKCNPLMPNWTEIVDYQLTCLKSGSNGIGIPDLLIAQNCIQYNTPIYSLDKHFTWMRVATIDIELYS